MREWNNDPIETPVFESLDQYVKSAIEKNIQTHLIMEQLETDIEKTILMNLMYDFLNSSKIYFFNNQKEKDNVMNYHKVIFGDGYTGNKFSIRHIERPTINRYFLFKDSFQASHLIKGCTFNKAIFVGIDKDSVDLSLFPSFFVQNEIITYEFSK